jgi:hypothetical protein
MDTRAKPRSSKATNSIGNYNNSNDDDDDNDDFADTDSQLDAHSIAAIRSQTNVTHRRPTKFIDQV